MLPVDEETIIRAVEKVVPAVVHISTVRVVRDQFFRVFPLEGQGSGVIIDPRGYIITNNHVIEGANRVQVSLPDGRSFEGDVVGMDPETDVAVIRINARDLPSVELGDSDALRIGQIAIAIGNPFGLAGGPTITAGVLGSVNRRIQTERGVMELIQTDAAINPGNSGGPLVDSHGRVIGINTMIIPFAHGIGFSIPVNIVKSIVEELIQSGRVVRPWIGLSVLTITRPLAEYYGLPAQEGLLVAGIVPGSPAEAVGLVPGDLIVEIEGKPVKESNEFVSSVRSRPIGDRVRLTIIRDGRRMTGELTLAQAPSPALLGERRRRIPVE